MAIQPGVGYTFTASSQGENFDVLMPMVDYTSLIYAAEPHPFKIINVQLGTTGGVATVRYQVKAGTYDNLVPVIDDFDSGTKVKLDRASGGVANPPTAMLTSSSYNADTKMSYISIRAGKSSTTNNFPDPVVTSERYPLVIGGNDPAIADTDTYGYLFIGTIKVDDTSNPTTFTVNQYVTGSIWANRIKLGSTDANYYYARI